MSFRGRGRGGGRGFGRGGGRGGRGRGGRPFQQHDFGPPEFVTEVGKFLHPCEGDLVCGSLIEKVPYFNAPIYLENKAQIGKVDEIFGAVQDYYFSVKLKPDMQASSFNADQKFYIDPMKLLPLARFLPQPKGTGRVEKRGGRGRGTPRGRGGFTPRGGGRGRGRGMGFRGSRGGGFMGSRGGGARGGFRSRGRGGRW